MTLLVRAGNLEPEETYVLLSHVGSCEVPSASFGWLGTLEVDASGYGELRTTIMRASAGGDAIDVAILADGLHIVSLRGPGITLCASIPPL
jgi:hypothetical protein